MRRQRLEFQHQIVVILMAHQNIRMLSHIAVRCLLHCDGLNVLQTECAQFLSFAIDGIDGGFRSKFDGNQTFVICVKPLARKHFIDGSFGNGRSVLTRKIIVSVIRSNLVEFVLIAATNLNVSCFTLSRRRFLFCNLTIPYPAETHRIGTKAKNTQA